MLEKVGGCLVFIPFEVNLAAQKVALLVHGTSDRGALGEKID